MKKVIKLLSLIVTFVLVLSLLCAPSVSAVSIGVYLNPYYYDLISCSYYDGVEWIDNTELATWGYMSLGAQTNKTTGRLYFVTGGVAPSGWRAAFKPTEYAGTMTVNAGDYFYATLTYYQATGYEQDLAALDHGLFVTTPNEKYQFSITQVVELENGDGTRAGYNVTFGGQLTAGYGFETGECTYELLGGGVGTSITTLDIDFYTLSMSTSDTPLSDTEAKIIESIDDATKEITQGWGTDVDTSGQIDDMSGGIADAESDALGGRTDAEVSSDVNSALTIPTLPARTYDDITVVASTFDKLLVAFGDGYQAVLVLGLTLGLAAFLVGRSYRAKGD